MAGIDTERIMETHDIPEACEPVTGVAPGYPPRSPTNWMKTRATRN